MLLSFSFLSFIWDVLGWILLIFCLGLQRIKNQVKIGDIHISILPNFLSEGKINLIEFLLEYKSFLTLFSWETLT